MLFFELETMFTFQLKILNLYPNKFLIWNLRLKILSIRALPCSSWWIHFVGKTFPYLSVSRRYTKIPKKCPIDHIRGTSATAQFPFNFIILTNHFFYSAPRTVTSWKSLISSGPPSASDPNYHGIKMWIDVLMMVSEWERKFGKIKLKFNVDIYFFEVTESNSESILWIRPFRRHQNGLAPNYSHLCRMVFYWLSVT